jgi:hypothetical protein
MKDSAIIQSLQQRFHESYLRKGEDTDGDTVGRLVNRQNLLLAFVFNSVLNDAMISGRQRMRKWRRQASAVTPASYK